VPRREHRRLLRSAAGRHAPPNQGTIFRTASCPHIGTSALSHARTAEQIAAMRAITTRFAARARLSEAATAHCASASQDNARVFPDSLRTAPPPTASSPAETAQVLAAALGLAAVFAALAGFCFVLIARACRITGTSTFASAPAPGEGGGGGGAGARCAARARKLLRRGGGGRVPLECGGQSLPPHAVPSPRGGQRRGLGFRVWGLDFRVRVKGLGFRV
jgi:hypothetical protein